VPEPTTTQRSMHRLPEVARRQADLVVYVPEHQKGERAENQHFLVTPTPAGTFLAAWTRATQENHDDQGIVVSRSLDRGKSWSEPVRIAGANMASDPDYVALNDNQASWAFPVVAPDLGRVYVFYNQNFGEADPRKDVTGKLAFRYSDDDGVTWSDRIRYLPIGRAPIDHPDPDWPYVNWITFQCPIITSAGEIMAGFTRWASAARYENKGLFFLESQIWFLRFDNVLTEPDPDKLEVTTLPQGDVGVRVPRVDLPGISVAQEPTIQSLSDGRLICIMRTLNGMIYYALSSDGARSWGEARPLRYCDGGEPMLQPIAPCPLYKTGDGRYFIVFHNNDGTANGGAGPADAKKNRTPAWITVGREAPGADGQPLVFNPPKVFLTNDAVPDGAVDRTSIAVYTSYFEYGGKHYFWYPDRKHYLLGKLLTDEVLDDAGLPR